MILYGVSLTLFLFITINLFFKSSAPLIWKIAGSAVILFVSLKYAIYQFLGGAFFSPELPRSFILLMEALYGGLIILFFLLILWDFYLAGNWLLQKFGIPTPKHLPSGWIKSGLCLLSLCLGIWGTIQAVSVPKIKIVELNIKNLPDALNGFSIVQLTDLHIGPLLKRNWLEKVVEKVNEAEPDLIALTGDYVDGKVDETLQEVEPLADLRAKYGVFGVTGNHEYYWNAVEWTEALKQLNVKMLENEHAIIKAGDERVVLAGVPDLAAARFGMTEPDVEQALKNAPDAVKILLSHQPKEIRSHAGAFDAQLSGHTHGGVLFFLQPLVARFNDGFVEGLYKLENSQLYVAPGVGIWNGFSCRVGVPPEITKIILKNSQIRPTHADNG